MFAYVPVGLLKRCVFSRRWVIYDLVYPEEVVV